MLKYSALRISLELSALSSTVSVSQCLVLKEWGIGALCVGNSESAASWLAGQPP